MSVKKFGIYDTKDNCWLGDDSGPRTFEDFMLARVAAQIWEDQVTGTDLGGRFKAYEIPEGSWNLKDHVAVKRSTLQSLRRVEGDYDLGTN